MRLAALVIVALVMALNGDARAGGNVDWSAYIDKDGSSPVPQSTTPTVVAEEDEAPAAKPAKRATKTTKAKKTSKAKSAKAKTRAKTKKRRK